MKKKICSKCLLPEDKREGFSVDLVHLKRKNFEGYWVECRSTIMCRNCLEGFVGEHDEEFEKPKVSGLVTWCDRCKKIRPIKFCIIVGTDLVSCSDINICRECANHFCDYIGVRKLLRVGVLPIIFVGIFALLYLIPITIRMFLIFLR